MKNRIRKRVAGGIGCAIFLLWCSAEFLSGQENLGRGRVSGTVVDEAGAPVANAQIVAESLQSATAKLTGTTDKKGHFAIAGFGTGPWKITASKAEYDSAFIEMDVRQLRTNPPVSLTLKKTSAIAAPINDDASKKDYDQANQLLAAGKFADAAVLYEDILAKHPELYQLQLDAGLCYLKLEDWEKAKSRFQAVLDRVSWADGAYENDAAAGKAFVGLGEVVARSGDLASAKDYFDRALRLAPEDEIAAYNVAEILFSAQKVDEAIGYYETALRIKKDWSKPVFKLGLAHLNKGDYDKALDYLTRFVEMDPENPNVPQARNMIIAIKAIKR
jgi:tetratricopeptide (TPR) repeat protein